MTHDEDSSLRLIAVYSPDVICRAALDLQIHYVTPNCHPVFGWTQEEMQQIGLLDLVIGEDRQVVAEAVQSSYAVGAKPLRTTGRMTRNDGSALWIEFNPSVVRDPITNQAIETVIVMRDVTARVLLEEQLAAMNFIDGLTGIGNRHAFDEALSREWSQMVRDGSQITLLLLDIDNFKQLNDHYGQNAGDECLRLVADAVRASVRGSDTGARYGSDEMAILLPGVDSSIGGRVANRVRSYLMDHLLDLGNGEQIRIAASVGVATVTAREARTMRTTGGLLQAADKALYQAKLAGRDQVASAPLVPMLSAAE